MKVLHPVLTLIERCEIHESAVIHAFTNLYDAKIGEGSVVGKFVEIGGAVIGKRTRIATHSYICPGVGIGDDCFIGHGVMFTNDLFSDSPDYPVKKDFILRKTKIGDRTRIGSGSVILPVVIGHDCIIGAGSVVTRDMPDGSTWAGNPARELVRNPAASQQEPRDQETEPKFGGSD